MNMIILFFKAAENLWNLELFSVFGGNRDQKVVEGITQIIITTIQRLLGRLEEAKRSGYSSMSGISFRPFYNRIGYQVKLVNDMMIME